MARSLLLTCGEATRNPFFSQPTTCSHLQDLDIYALGETHLDPYAALLIPTHADQRYLATLGEKFKRFLGAGKTLVFCGHLAYPFLPELKPFVPLTVQSFEDYRVCRVHEHPIFAGVDTDDLTFRRGVAGFYGRGHNPPPADALVLNRLGSSAGPPVDYVYQRSGGGRVLVHAGNDLWMYAADQTSARRVAPQLLEWIASTSEAVNV